MKECVSKKTILKKKIFFCLFKLSQLIFTWFGTFGKLAGYFDVKIAIMISYSYNYYPPLCLSNIRVSNSRNETFYLENKFLHWKKLIWGIFSRVNWAKKIRIGYVLKSADVGTLFSRRNSENSSHTLAHTCTHPRTPTHTPHIPADALNLINHMKLHVNGNN